MAKQVTHHSKCTLYRLITSPCISISFCAGADNSCVSRGGGAGIRTMANASLSSPGVITHTYDSALSPQIGQQIFLC